MQDIDKARYYTNALLIKGFVCDEYPEWINHGFSLASLGEHGRELFHSLSSTSKKYKYEDADKKFTSILRSHNGKKGIGSFIRYCTEVHQIPTYPKSHLSIDQRALKRDKLQDENKWHYNLREILNHPQEPKVWGPFIKGGNNSIVASSEAGKTTLIRNLISCVLLGQKSFLGWDINAPRKKVIVVSSEDGIGSAADFFRVLLQGESDKIYDNVEFIFDGYDLIERLTNLFAIHPADVLFIDTWGDAIGGEYQSDTTRKKMQDIRNICRLNDATPIYLHHTNKASENIPDKSSIKGAGDFEQAMRCVLMLTIYKDARWLCIVKSNDTPDHEKDVAQEIAYDPSTKRISLTGRKESRKHIIQNLRKEMYSNGTSSTVAWEDMMEPRLYTFTELKNLCINVSAVSDRTAERKIKNAKDSGDLSISNGKYHLPSYRHTQTS